MIFSLTRTPVCGGIGIHGRGKEAREREEKKGGILEVTATQLTGYPVHAEYTAQQKSGETHRRRVGSRSRLFAFRVSSSVGNDERENFQSNRLVSECVTFSCCCYCGVVFVHNTCV